VSSQDLNPGDPSAAWAALAAAVGVTESALRDADREGRERKALAERAGRGDVDAYEELWRREEDSLREDFGCEPEDLGMPRAPRRPVATPRRLTSRIRGRAARPGRRRRAATGSSSSSVDPGDGEPHEPDVVPSPGAVRAFCVRGHALTPENTYVRASGKLECRECERIRTRARRGQGPPLSPISRDQPRADVEERFWEKVQVGPHCWLWLAGRDGNGYGKFSPEGRRLVGAHRFSYELLVGPIPDGLHIDHLCRVPLCVNPAHMEPVTCQVNVLRGIAPTARNARKTHCDHGHEFTPENTRRGESGRRICRECERRRKREFLARKATA